MNVLFASMGFLPAQFWGGPVQVMYHNAMELQRRGHSVTVCASNLQDKHRRIGRGCFESDVDGIRTVYLHTYLVPDWPGTVGPTLLSPSSLYRLWYEVRAADVVHAHGTRNVIVMSAALFASLQRKAFVLQPHGSLPHIISSIHLKRLFDYFFMRRLLNSADVLIALQNSEQKQIIDAGGNPDLIRIIPNGLKNTNYDVDRHRGKFRAMFDIPPNRKVILFLGRINRKKGVDLLLRAFALFPEPDRVQTQLIIAGPDDGQLNEAQFLTSKLGLDQQTLFTGLLTGEEVVQAYVDADVFVLPCRTDTFPMTILEACRSGTPIVVTETCEIADKIDGVAGVVVPVDVKAISNALSTLLHNEVGRNKYSAGGRRLLDTEFSLHVVGERLESIYASTLRNKQV